VPNTVGAIGLLKVIIQRLGLPIFLILGLFLVGCDGDVSQSEASVKGDETGVSADESLAQSGESIYESKCRACHDYGVAGAPRFGDSAVWAGRLIKGMDLLYKNSINGVRAMPARGGCYACSDDEIEAAVDYILANSQ
jgi:cytochrome c5